MNKIKEFKNIYLGIKVPDSKMQQRWEKLKKEMTPIRKFPFPYFRYGVMFLGFMVLMLASLVWIAQVSQPGSLIYSVKVLSDKIISKVKGKPEYKVEKRAEDLIEVSKNEPENAKEAADQYQKALEETEKEVGQKEKPKIQFEESLEKQEVLLKKAIKENPKAQKELNQALENTVKVKENLNEDKMEKTNENPSGNPGQNTDGNSNNNRNRN